MTERAPSRILAVYRTAGTRDEAAALGRRIALEQTVEVPEHIVPSPILQAVVGRVEHVATDPESADHCFITLSYDAGLANRQLPQLLNLIYGNVAMYRDVRLVDLDLPASLLARFEGPPYGVEGLRALLGVYGRPLLSTAFKPRGSTVEEFAKIGRGFALGGGDIIKDDQNLVEDSFEAFKLRVTACAQAISEAADRTGRRCLYFPHIAAPLPELERHFELVRALDLKGVLLCPMVLGLETARALCARYGLALMGHPAMSGAFTNGDAHGISHGLLLGTLYRLAGADISVFPNFGGRFSYSREQCQDIRRRLQEPLGGMKSAWPCPAGGMHLGNFSSMCRDYGEDAVFLVGGALLGDSGDLQDSTRRFLDRIRVNFEERLETPQDAFVSSCELPSSAEDMLTHLPFLSGFQWQGRTSSAYKESGEQPHAGVRRVELIGKHGERAAFDLRYFEIEPHGYSSLERHLHTHVIIGARGQGILDIGGRQMAIKPMDVGYVEPLKPHQLRNEGNEPFGFFCIVDHERDRPMSA
jgi:ribulose-bisphosphate carboxylase large chain